MTLTPEEKQIVAWLRRDASKIHTEQSRYKHWTAEWLSCRDQIESAQEYANAIERLEHRPTSTPKTGE